MQNSDEKYWYAIRVTYNREMKVKKDLDDKGIENFVPMQYTIVNTRDNRRIKKLVPAIHNLIFIYTTQAEMVEYKANSGMPIRYIMNYEKKTPITVPNSQMSNFIAVAGNVNEQIIYLNCDTSDLHKGDRVRILGGVFEGAVGTLKRIRGDRRVVVTIPGVIAVATTHIHPSLLEKLPPE
ncbi:MAG: UpxY family transcription antiterminator [Muribaculaceae bacterium]